MTSLHQPSHIPSALVEQLPRPPRRLTLRYNHIHIIEWLPEGERRTGKELQDFLIANRPDIPASLHVASSVVDVSSALELIAATTERDGTFPLLQIEAHGGESARGYYGPGPKTSKDLLPWEAIRDQLARINRSSRANLILFSAACWGLGALMAAAGGPLPFMAIVGPTDSIEPRALLEASKEFYRRALPTTPDTPTIEAVVESSARELGKPDGLAWDSMVEMTYQALLHGLWIKCDPEIIRESALDIAEAQRVPGSILDLSGLPYSTAIDALHRSQGRAAEYAWRERLYLDEWPENEARFAFDIEGLVRMILDARFNMTC